MYKYNDILLNYKGTNVSQIFVRRSAAYIVEMVAHLKERDVLLCTYKKNVAYECYSDV